MGVSENKVHLQNYNGLFSIYIYKYIYKYKWSYKYHKS